MSGAEASGPSGVVRNSALSFLAPALSPMQPENASAPLQDTAREQMTQSDRLVPAGLKALCDACSRLYPDQPNPLQVTTRLKYWLGGHDPLDYISMYWNPGKPEEHIPPHWHYVSFGLSDLHGDGRVHPPPDRVVMSAGTGPPSGYGLELTLRLSGEPTQPPLWPAALLQALARYIFTTGNKFCAGDHISWHAALDGGAGANSRLRHLLVADDVQLGTVDTPHGTVAFLQMVGCTARELRAAQRGSGFDVLKHIAEDPRCGGSWLVTRVGRASSARGVARPKAGCSAPPAALAGVSARLRWEPWTPPHTPQNKRVAEPPGASLSPRVEQLIKDTLQRGLSCMGERTGPEGHMSTDSFEMSSMERALPQLPDLMQESLREDEVEYFDGVHLLLNAEGASLLPLAMDGRVAHGRHFTWREGSRAVTVLPAVIPGALPNDAHPYAARGLWLQLVLPPPLSKDISDRTAVLATLACSDSESDEEEVPQSVNLPLVLSWPEYGLKITVVNDQDIL